MKINERTPVKKEYDLMSSQNSDGTLSNKRLMQSRDGDYIENEPVEEYQSSDVA